MLTRRSLLKPLTLTAALAATLSPLSAALFLTAGQLPTGTVRFDDSSTYDDAVASVATSVFGGSPARVSVGVNGNLNFSDDFHSSNTSLPGGVLRISPLWSDLVLYAGHGGSIVSYESPGAYLAVNWNGINSLDQSPGASTATFQAVIFGGNVSVNGASFAFGDIVFSYDSVGIPLDSGNSFGATVGINVGDGTYSPVPGTTDGLVSNAAKGALLPTDNHYILFHPNASGGYVASVQTTAVPEPAEYAAVAGLALVAFGTWRRTRR